MPRQGLLIRLVRFARVYLVALSLVGVLALTFFRALAGGSGPVLQHPPEGISIVRNSEQLQWSMGRWQGAVRVQVAAGEPKFSGKLFVDKKVNSTKHLVGNLKPGTTYYWRISQNGKSSRVSKFHVAKDAVAY